MIAAGERTRLAYPDVGHAVLMTLALLALQLVAGFSIGVVLAIGQRLGQGDGGAIVIPPAALLAINLVSFGAILWWAFAANRGRNHAVFSGGRGGLLAWLAMLPAVPGLAILVSTCANLLAQVLPMSKDMVDAFAQLLDLDAHPVVAVLTIGVVAPVAEEILFRGYILRGLLDRLRPRSAVILSAVLFAVMHANLWQIPVGLGLGLLCGWVYLRTRSVPLCIAVHAANNALALFASRLPFTVPGFNDGPGANTMTPWWFVLLGAGLLGLGVSAFSLASRNLRVPPPLPAPWAEPPLLPQPVAALLAETPAPPESADENGANDSPR